MPETFIPSRVPPRKPVVPTARSESAALFDAARSVMFAAYGEAIRHMSPLDAALEAEATSAALRQLRELADGTRS